MRQMLSKAGARMSKAGARMSKAGDCLGVETEKKKDLVMVFLQWEVLDY